MKPPRLTAGQMALFIMGGFMFFIGIELSISREASALFGLLSGGLLMVVAIFAKK